MRIGVVYPQTEFGNDPQAIRDYAQTAEGLGYTHVLAYDHVLGANPDRPGDWDGPYTYQTPFQSPFLLFSFMAAVTSQLRFTTGIIILPQRQTALVASVEAEEPDATMLPRIDRSWLAGVGYKPISSRAPRRQVARTSLGNLACDRTCRETRRTQSWWEQRSCTLMGTENPLRLGTKLKKVSPTGWAPYRAGCSQPCWTQLRDWRRSSRFQRNSQPCTQR